MPTLILSCRYTEDSQRLWRAGQELGWDVVRLENWRLPKRSLPDPVVYVESLFAPMIAEQLGITLSEPPEDWLAKLHYHYSKREVILTTLTDAKTLLPAFVKPPNSKSFPAKVYETFPDYLVDECTVLVQEEVEFIKEFRCFCLDKKVLTSSVYLRHGMVQKHENWYSSFAEDQEVKEFVETVLNDVETPNAIVVDVGIIKDRGWAVVELNAAWGSGLYGCNPKEVLKVINLCMEKNYE